MDPVTSYNLKSSIEATIDDIIRDSVKEVVGQYAYTIQKTVKERIDAQLQNYVNTFLKEVKFPDSSIPARSIDYSDFRIDASKVYGLPKHQGIEDFAKSVELTILDGNVVVENKITTQNIEANTIKVKNLEVGEVWKHAMASFIINQLPKPAIDTTILNNTVNEIKTKLEENLSKGNTFKELEVSGEALLSDVLYTTPGNHRVGINTTDPSDALTVWDQETEVVIGKHKSQEGYVGTRRNQALNIGSNNAVGLRVNTDGSVKIDKLQLGERNISFSNTVPGYSAKRGDIVLNDSPQVGRTIGWVCIDGIKWAGFGKIE